MKNKIASPKARPPLRRSEPQHAQRAGEEQCRWLAEAMPQIVWTAGPDGEVKYFNQQWFDYTGLTFEQSRGRGWLSAVHAEDAQKCSEGWEAAVKSEGVFQLQFRLKRARDGAYRWHQARAIPASDRDGRLIQWLATCTDIQDELQAEEKLLQTKERFHLLVQSVKEYAILMLDSEGRIVSWNIGAERIKGYRAEEVLNQHFSMFFTPEDRELGKPGRLLSEAAARGSTEDEGWRLRKDLSRFWANVVITALRDEAGQLQGFVKVTRDITARRQTEQELRLYMELVKNAPIGLLVLHLEDPEDARTFRILAANPAVTETTGMQGVSVTELIGKNLTEVFPALPGTDLPDLGAAVVRSGRPRHIEQVPYADERVAGGLFSVDIFPLPGQCAGIAFENITERKKAEADLRANEARTRLIVDTAYDAFIAMDSDGRIADWNRQAEIVFGWTREEARGKPLVEMIIPEQYRQAHQRGMERFLSTGEGPVLGKRMELTALRRTGEEFPVELTIAPIQWGESWLFSAFVRDITERKRAEEELQRTTAELTRSNSELEQFAYVASHDLQEPLRMVASSTNLLARDYQDKLDEGAREYITFAIDGAKRMQVLIDQLLKYSRLGAKRMPFETVDCQQVFAAAVANLKVAIDETSAVVASDPLPTVMGDGVQLLQLFQNLIANAIKFRGEAPPRVHVTAKLKEDEWEFAVRDNGIGIEPKHFDRLFVIFQRLHSRDAYPGTGIGLAICKKVVELHGGRIWVESRPRQGATFYFTIPLAKPA